MDLYIGRNVKNRYVKAGQREPRAFTGKEPWGHKSQHLVIPSFLSKCLWKKLTCDSWKNAPTFVRSTPQGKYSEGGEVKKMVNAQLSREFTRYQPITFWYVHVRLRAVIHGRTFALSGHYEGTCMQDKRNTSGDNSVEVTTTSRPRPACIRTSLGAPQLVLGSWKYEAGWSTSIASSKGE